MLTLSPPLHAKSGQKAGWVVHDSRLSALERVRDREIEREVGSEGERAREREREMVIVHSASKTIFFMVQLHG